MAKKNKSEDSDLNDMREQYRKHKARAANGGGGGGGSNNFHKLGDGKNLLRVLPRPGHKKFYTEGWTHFNVGPNNRAVRCIDEGSVDPERGLPGSGTKCPLCKKFLREQSRINSEYQKGDEEGRAEWKKAKDKYVPRHQHYANVLVADDDGDAEVKILGFGQMVWSQLMNYYLGDDTNIGDFTDPEGGQMMNIKKSHKGGRDRKNIGYEVFPTNEPEDISDSWDDIKGMLHDLDAAAGKVMSKDEVIAVMKGIDLDKGSGSDDDDDDDSDEDDDDDDEEEEEDEDEDDRPVKKSKLGSKLKNKKRD